MLSENNNPHIGDHFSQRLASVETGMMNLREVLEKSIQEWRSERNEIRNDIRDLASTMRGKGTQWGVIISAIGVAVAITLALGQGFVTPVQIKAEKNETEVQELRSEAFKSAVLYGILNAKVSEKSDELQTVWKIIHGDSGSSGMIAEIASLREWVRASEMSK